MRFVVLETGCIVCLSHRPNRDGYLRKGWGNRRTGDRVMEMFHRTIYRMHKGEIPDGYEVDHMCKIRLCCNPDHLQALEGHEHAIRSNQERKGFRHHAPLPG